MLAFLHLDAGTRPPKSKIEKLDSRAPEALMMGYSSHSKGYKRFDIESKNIIVSWDIKFEEFVDCYLSDSKSDPPLIKIESKASSDHSSSPNDPDTNILPFEEPTNPLPTSEQTIRRSTRVSKPPSEWWNYIHLNLLKMHPAWRSLPTMNQNFMLKQ